MTKKKMNCIVSNNNREKLEINQFGFEQNKLTACDVFLIWYLNNKILLLNY